MKIILTFIQKEFQQLRRDPKMIGLNFFAPIFQLIVLGYAATLDVRDIPTIVYDMDDSRTSREFVTKFTECGYFSLVRYAGSYADIDRAIDTRAASIAVVIPIDFSDNLLSGEQVTASSHCRWIRNKLRDNRIELCFNDRRTIFAEHYYQKIRSCERTGCKAGSG